MVDYVDYRHSRNGGAKERMGPGRVEAFDKAVRERIQRQFTEYTLQIQDGRLHGTVTADVTWGKPLAGPQASDECSKAPESRPA